MKPPFRIALLLAATALLAPAADAFCGAPSPEALAEVNRARRGIKVDVEGIEDTGRLRSSYGRPAEEVEGWRLREGGERWPVDQATFDARSGMLSKYVNFEHASRRRAGEAILPMSTVSSMADGYLGVFFPRNDLSLDGVERFKVSGKEGVYYEVVYNPQPVEVPFLIPLVKILVDASTGRLYRYELAADHLGAGAFPRAGISGTAAGKIAALFLSRPGPAGRLGGGVTGVTVTEMYYVRPNDWLGAVVPAGGEARAAWVVQFRTAGQPDDDPGNLLFVDAVSGRIIGGLGPAAGR